MGRGILAFIVFLAHIGQIFWFPAVGDTGFFADLVGNLANISVVFFFVLSGMLISYSAVNLCEGNTFNWKKYLINRITRIYPSLIFVLILCALLVFIYPILNNGSNSIARIPGDEYIARQVFTTDLINFIKAFFMIQPGLWQINGPLWSLSIEWWLYISGLFVFLGMTVGNISKYLYYLIGIAVLYLAYYGYGEKVFFYITIWFLGFLYTIYFRFHNRNFKILVASALLSLVLLLVWKGIDAININAADYKVYGLVQIIYSIIFIPISLKYSGKSIFQDMSKYSYTLYIIHFPVALFVFSLFHTTVKNDYLFLSVETLLLIIIIVVSAKFVGKYTEDKYKFRSLTAMLFNRNPIRIDK